MTTPRERIEADLKTALKAGEKERLSTVRLLMTAMTNERIRTGEELDEAGFLTLVRRSMKQRKESAEQYRKGERNELAEKEEREAEILARYLPPQVGEDEIRSAIRDLVAAEGLSGPAAIGPIMKTMLARFGGSADGATINRLAREILSG